VGDTLNRIAHAIDESKIEWVSMRHEESGAFAAGAEAQLTGHLTACAGSWRREERTLSNTTILLTWA
jgi:pyruvate dehydrogenase (quinone)